MTRHRPTRRHLLALAAGASLLTLGANPALAVAATAASRPRVLVLVELNGGNDGLNTVVPYGDPSYGRLRRRLAVGRDKVAQLDERLGLNASLAELMTAWTAGDLAIALGVGYARPNRSHFRSIEIWNTASDSEETLQDGWIGRVFQEAGGAAHGLRDGLAADGLVLGGAAGPLEGGDLRTLVLHHPERFLRQTARLQADQTATTNPALAHILEVRGEVDGAARMIQARLQGAGELGLDFPQSPIARQFALAARLIAAEVPVTTIKLAQTGYDTHAGQAGRHPRLLAELAAALAAFRAAMTETGHWERVLVMTYAEFGRRAAANASGGTDHGTAAPHFLLGGRVRGGLYGRHPSLTDLEAGDLKHGIDFRRLYATAAQGWWGLPPGDALKGAKPLPCLA